MSILSEQLDRLIYRDPELRALRALARSLGRLPARRSPDAALQVVADLSRQLTRARYAALAVTDRHDRTEGFFTAGVDPAVMARLRTPPQGHGPLGSLRYDGKPVLFEDVREHAKAFGFPPSHPAMQRVCGVAIWTRGEVRGALYIADRTDGKPFTEEDEATLTTLAAHASRVVETEWY